MVTEPNIATMNFQITKISGLWQQVKKCRWENGNKKIEEVQKNENYNTIYYKVKF
jgi:hypothetical protein